MNAPQRDQLLAEGVVAKFLRYVQVDSPSGQGEGVPSTEEQWAMARLLEAELKAMGLSDVKVDDHAIVTARLPGNREGAPTIGLLAHFDTFPGTPGHGVKPLVHRAYDGGEIRLPAGPVLRPEELPGLRRCVGHDIITSDGSTLLGADDKAGVAEIMEILCRLIRQPEIPHGPILVGFTPDEETGRGVRKFDVASFPAVAAYTFDGSAAGEVESENFNARNLKVTIAGRSAHTGTARGVMINAVQLAAEFISSIPATMRPETTDGYEGFIHADAVSGNVEEVTVKLLLRDFSEEGIARQQAIVESLLAGLEQRYPGARTSWEQTGGYKNMKAGVSRDPRVVELALKAVREAGLEPVQKPIRGGTDGSVLTEMGLPCPNLFTGGMNYHSRTEWASAQWMEKAVEVGLNLVQLWAAERA
ncbi:tripeptide aminopeptidase [Symbiobacterium terraclitae]|jgi:tripeptide aminopeptidase|uniref:Peptidase T n=1 Tax=Symbiobacterium terraclitae TaxID=557451 RepID=A0ABS4JXW8_9FIRM|nr:peptidase T [Symbiobacterium terraclitae]MBP2019836.1 tripeptide aminopeptidase [Symbiobacterium terraclitae]